MSKIYFFVLLLTLYTVPVSSQSVNAYYDAIRLSEIAEAKDTVDSKTILQILTIYNRNYRFKTTQVTDLYINAIKKLFSLDVLFKWFFNQQSRRPVQKITGELYDILDKYMAIKRQAEWLDNQTNAFNARFESLKPQISDSITFNEPVNNKRLMDSLVNYFTAFPDLQKKIVTREIIESSFRKLITPATALQVLDSIGYQQNILYTDSAGKLSKKILEITAVIQNFYIAHFDELRKNINLGTDKGNNEKIRQLNNSITSTAFYIQSNNFSETQFRKNETASLTNFKLPSQTEMIDAMAIYLAKRFKQELALTIVDQFRKTLKNDRLLNDLFPETYKMFKSGELFEMPSFGSAWNYAISKDFTNMLSNLSVSPVVKEKIGDTMMVTYLQNIIKLSTLINKQYSYVDAVSQLYHQDQSSNFFVKTIRSLHIINKELFDTAQASQFWINPEGLYALDEKQLDIFYALIREKYNNDLGVINATDLGSPEMQPRIRNMISSMLVLLNNFQNNRRSMMTMQGSNTVQPGAYWDFLMSLFETLQTQETITPAPLIQKYVLITNLCFETYSMLSEKNYTGAALKLVDLLPAIKDHHYVDLEAICFSASKLQKVIGSSGYQEYKPVQVKIDRLNKLIKSYLFTQDLRKELIAHSSDYRYLLTDPRILQLEQSNPNLKLGSFKNNLLLKLEKDTLALKRQIDSLSAGLQREIVKKNFTRMEVIPVSEITKLIIRGSPETKKYISQSGDAQFEIIRKVTGFLSDMVLAGNSRNLSQVIEKYALPANSYKIKRNTRRSWDLNAYVGAYLGGEMLTGGKNSVSPVYGFSVPLGVSYSWGRTMNAKGSDLPIFHTRKGERVLRGNSFTVNLSLVDIGAVVSFRLTNDASKGLPQEVKWSQVISPGLHFRWGIRETPICFSAGIQNTPQLRKLNNTSPAVSAVRLYTGFFFDIPLLNISYK